MPRGHCLARYNELFWHVRKLKIRVGVCVYMYWCVRGSPGLMLLPVPVINCRRVARGSPYQLADGIAHRTRASRSYISFSPTLASFSVPIYLLYAILSLSFCEFLNSTEAIPVCPSPLHAKTLPPLKLPPLTPPPPSHLSSATNLRVSFIVVVCCRRRTTLQGVIPGHLIAYQIASETPF